MTDQSVLSSFGLRDPIGLCATCRHARIVQSSHGSTFYLCQRSEVDPTQSRGLSHPRFAKYPHLPVLKCAGYEPSVEDESSHRAQAAHPATGGDMGKTGTVSSHPKMGIIS